MTLRLPATLADVETLEDLLSEPTPALVEMMQRLHGDVLVLGVGGKMGPSLARMAKRASEQAGVMRRVIGVSRFRVNGLKNSLKPSPETSLETASQNPSQTASTTSAPTTLEASLNAHGIETVRCDLLDPNALARLPDAPNIVYMAGMKFGANDNQPLTWAMNSYLPGMVCQRFPRSRIVAFSTGNIYGLTPLSRGGSVETDEPAPIGDYAMSCLGRERIFTHFSHALNIPVALIRLNYAVEMRYGVLLDIAQRVQSGQTVDVSMAMANVIWQADANAHSLLALEHAASPARFLNVTGPETISIRRVAEQFGALLNKSPVFAGEEAGHALLNNAQYAHWLFGPPRVPLQQLLCWTADWVQRDAPTLNKPTRFEVRDGTF